MNKTLCSWNKPAELDILIQSNRVIWTAITAKLGQRPMQRFHSEKELWLELLYDSQKDPPAILFQCVCLVEFAVFCLRLPCDCSNSNHLIWVIYHGVWSTKESQWVETQYVAIWAPWLAHFSASNYPAEQCTTRVMDEIKRFEGNVLLQLSAKGNPFCVITALCRVCTQGVIVSLAVPHGTRVM